MAIKNDLRSKLTDGVLAGGVLIMLELLMILLVKPIQLLFPVWRKALSCQLTMRYEKIEAT